MTYGVTSPRSTPAHREAPGAEDAACTPNENYFFWCEKGTYLWGCWRNEFKCSVHTLFQKGQVLPWLQNYAIFVTVWKEKATVFILIALFVQVLGIMGCPKTACHRLSKIMDLFLSTQNGHSGLESALSGGVCWLRWQFDLYHCTYEWVSKVRRTETFTPWLKLREKKNKFAVTGFDRNPFLCCKTSSLAEVICAGNFVARQIKYWSAYGWLFEAC